MVMLFEMHVKSSIKSLMLLKELFINKNNRTSIISNYPDDLMDAYVNGKRCLWARRLENVNPKSTSSSCPTHCYWVFQVKKLISAPKSKIILFQISIYWLWRRYAYWPSIYLYNIWYCSNWNRTGRFDWPAQTAWSWNLDGRRPFAEPCYWYRTDWRRIHSGFVW